MNVGIDFLLSVLRMNIGSARAVLKNGERTYEKIFLTVRSDPGMCPLGGAVAAFVCVRFIEVPFTGKSLQNQFDTYEKNM